MKRVRKLVENMGDMDRKMVTLGDIERMLREKSSEIMVPRGLLDAVDKLTKKELVEVGEDLLLAKETIYRVVQGLNKQYYYRVSNKILRSRKEKSAVPEACPLNAVILRRISNYGSDNYRYKRVMDLLIKRGVIELYKEYSTKASRSRMYNYPESIMKTKLEKYELKHEQSIEMNTDYIVKTIKDVEDNPIAKTAFYTRFKVELPTLEEAEESLVNAYKRGYKNNKGDPLRRIGKKNRNRFKGKCVFIEDYLENYKLLKDSLYMPLIGGDRSGGRVVTPFTLMPSVIRKGIKIRGIELVDCDFSCAHPNMIWKVLGLQIEETITHEMVARYITKGFDSLSEEDKKKAIKKVKREHLMYFNMPHKSMVHLEVHKYYKDKCGDMVEKLIRLKKSRGHKEISSRLFKLEVEIMTEVQKELTKRSIDAVYVYDCFMVEPHNKEYVDYLMQRVALEKGTLMKVGK